MKIPVFNANPKVSGLIEEACRIINERSENTPEGSKPPPKMKKLEISDLFRAIEYMNYQMPPLIVLNFSDEDLDGFEIISRIMSDPWMNHGGIIGLYENQEDLARIDSLENTNIIISMHFGDIIRQMPTVLSIMRENQQFLFQRALHTALLSSTSGEFILGLDLLLVPCYANLVANYLFNVGSLDNEAKAGVSLALTEMLTNAIEHGNCQIDAKQKTAYLEEHASIQDLILEKSKDPAVSARKVYFHYLIEREQSSFSIRDEGAGFDWRSHLDGKSEIDFLATHGRGIFLTRQIAKEISYNDAGNEVHLVIQHHSNRASSVPGVMKDNELVEFKPGDVVFQQGEESDFLYYLAEGVYSVEINGKHVDNLTPDDILIGEMSFLLEEQRSATVVATTPGKLIKVSKEDFINIIQNQPYYGLFLSKLIAKRLHRLGREMSPDS